MDKKRRYSRSIYSRTQMHVKDMLSAATDEKVSL